MLMAMEIGQLEALVAVARLGGFTRAAAALNLSQPAVSRRLGLLERELGAPLFERIPSGIVLTAAGQAFLPHAEALLASMRDGVDAVRALAGDGPGSHHAGAGRDAGEHHGDGMPAGLPRSLSRGST